MLRRHVILLKAIRPSDGDVKTGGPLGAFREEQAMSRHRVSPSPFLSSSSHTTQLRYTNRYTNSHPTSNFLQHCTDTLPTHTFSPNLGFSIWEWYRIYIYQKCRSLMLWRGHFLLHPQCRSRVKYKIKIIEIISEWRGSGKPLSHQCSNSAYVVHFFSETIYNRGLEFLHVIYENFDCDLTQGFFI